MANSKWLPFEVAKRHDAYYMFIEENLGLFIQGRICSWPHPRVQLKED